MLCCLIAYDATGNVIATLDHVVASDDRGNAIGLVDFAAHEEAGGKFRGIWTVDGAVGSGVWPEWLGSAAYEFRVELTGATRIGALTHKASGHRRERAVIEAAIAARKADAGDGPVDLRDLVGGPDRPLALDANGRTVLRAKATRPNLPLVGLRRQV